MAKKFTTPAPKSVEWYRKGVAGGGQRDTIFNRLKAKLIGGKDDSGTSYFKLHDRKLSKSDADTIIANMKQDMDGYPMFSTSSTSGEDEREYQEWIIDRYLDAPASKSSKTTSSSGTTSVYKPADKFVDDKVEELDKKLEETSDQIMDAVDALIEQQKQAFEEFKRQEAEKVKQRIAGREQYSEPIGPKEKSKEFGYNQYETAIGPLPMQGPKQAPKKTSYSDDDPWESEVNDQLGTKLDELIDQVKKDPLPQPSTKRRKTKGKTPVKRRKLLGDSAGISTTISEIHQNVVDTKETLFNLYKVESERFELRKKTDKELSTLLKSKERESSLEGDKLKPASEKEKDDDKRKPDVFDKAVSAGLISAVTAFILPLALNAMRPFFKSESDELEKELKEPDDGEVDAIAEETKENTEAPVTSPEAAPPPVEQTPVEQQPTPSPTPVQSSENSQLSPLYQGPPLRMAAKGGKFTPQGKHEKLKPIQKQEAKQPEGVRKLLKPMLSAITLPLKAAAFGPLLLAKTILSPFASFLPPQAVDFVKGIFNNVARSAGLSGFDFSITSAGKGLFEKLVDLVKSIFQPLFDLFKSSPRSSTPPTSNTPSSNTPTGKLDQKAVASSSADGQIKKAGFGQSNFSTFKSVIASKESGGKYDIQGGSGGMYSGRYQMGAAARKDAARLLGETYQGDDEAARKKFREDPEMQERYFAAYTRANHGYLTGTPEYDKLDEKGKLEVLAYAHNAGAGNAIKWLKGGRKESFRDGFNTKSSDYADAVKAALNKPTPTPPPKPAPPTPRPRPQSRTAQISQRLQERREQQNTKKPTVPVGTASDKQSGG